MNKDNEMEVQQEMEVIYLTDEKPIQIDLNKWNKLIEVCEDDVMKGIMTKDAVIYKHSDGRYIITGIFKTNYTVNNQVIDVTTGYVADENSIVNFIDLVVNEIGGSQWMKNKLVNSLPPKQFD